MKNWLNIKIYIIECIIHKYNNKAVNYIKLNIIKKILIDILNLDYVKYDIIKKTLIGILN